VFNYLHKNSLVKIYCPYPLEQQEEYTDNVYHVLGGRWDMQHLALFLKLHSLTRATNAIDATVVDHLTADLRFQLLYLIQSPSINTRFILFTWASETKPAVSLQSIFPGFNWAEREIWDIYGLFLVKHPDLRRILTDYGFVGHPLRKDFPLTGFKEVQYEDLAKQVEYGYTELSQSYRLLSFGNPWRHE